MWSALRTAVLVLGAVVVPLGGDGPAAPSAGPVAGPAARVVAARVVPAAVPVAAPVPAVAVPALPAGTGWVALDEAIARIPGYADKAPTTWRASGRSGHLGSTLLPAEVVSISPAVPPALIDAVVRHEWSHVLQFRVYGGDTAAMVAALDAAFDGSGPPGVENAADCMARQLGATWTHYTDCRDPRWQAAATRLLAGQRL
ncbi:MAG TPA: hypothetical protein VFR07_14565 [Mycobacteriales bacterium]|nr:hypothetical protein [Mycobacteriales bacterium]